MATTTRRDGDGWVLSGQKYYVSGFDASQWVLVAAAPGSRRPPAGGRSRCSSSTPTPPASATERCRRSCRSRSGRRRSTSTTSACRRIASSGGRATDLATAFAGMDAERLLVSSICTGLGRYALEKAVDYARHRAVWSAPIGAHQGIAHPLAAVKIELETARLRRRGRTCFMTPATSQPSPRTRRS